MAGQHHMFNRMISHFVAERRATAHKKSFNAFESRYVESLGSLYARIYGN